METSNPLSILMMTHHRKAKMHNRPFPMAYHLSQRGHHVTLIVTADYARIRCRTDWMDGVKIIEMPDLLWGRYRSGWDLWNALRKTMLLTRTIKDFDLIYAHETRPSTILPVLGSRLVTRTPLIIDWNDWWGGEGGIVKEVRSKFHRMTVGWLETLFEERFRHFADGTTTISSPLRQRAIDLGIPSDSTYIMRGGTNALSTAAFPKLQCRSLVNLPDNIPILGFSSLDSHLDMDLIFKAFQVVLASFPSCKLVITGSASQEVRRTANSYGLNENIIWTGFVSSEDLMHYLGSCDVCLLPLEDKIYNRGRWPNKLMDYITVGRPVVANPVGDIAQVIKDNNIGILVGWNHREFADAVIRLIQDETKAQAMGTRARQLAETTLAWPTLVTDLEDFFTSTISNKNEVRTVGGKE